MILKEFGVPGGLVVTILTLILTGALVPGKTVAQLLEQSRAGASAWKELYESERKARLDQSAMAKESVEAVRTVEHIVRAIDQKAGGSEL